MARDGAMPYEPALHMMAESWGISLERPDVNTVVLVFPKNASAFQVAVVLMHACHWHGKPVRYHDTVHLDGNMRVTMSFYGR